MKIISDVIIQEVFNVGGNKILRQCGIDSFGSQNNTRIISNTPFVVAFGGRNILFTRNDEDSTNAEYEYVIYTNKKPNPSLFNKGEIHFVKWLKHPLFSSTSPEDIVNSWRGKFLYTKEDVDNNGLRVPQLGAIYAFMSKAQSPQQQNIIVMPTGTGKTETMLSLLIANQCNKLLVTVPSDALREQLSLKFISLGILPKFKIIADDCHCPYVAIIKQSMSIDNWANIINASNVVITTMPLISQASDDVKALLSNEFTHLFVDEAHHSEAETWSSFINTFSSYKVTLFTATPFRNDGKRLQGEFIYSFSLKDAQGQGYYKPIKFIPVREYDKEKADKLIADTAVAQLKEDIVNYPDHILMARCQTKKRASEILQYYQQYEEFNPIVVYSSIPNKATILNDIKRGKHQIIICVNMLGEGFDLPEMKIAAIHDARQSIAVTLQFIGRFTRTAHDNTLGNASFVTNIAYPPIQEELQELYAKDADWNRMLPLINDGTTKDEIDLNEYLSSFKGMEESNVPFQNIEPALSTVIYRTGIEWNPLKWKEFFSEGNFDYRFGCINSEGDTLIIILGSIEKIDWGTIDSIQNLSWNVVVVHRHCTPKYNHAYINSSSGVDTDKLAKALFGNNDQTTRIVGNNLFRIFSGVKRLAVVNFGGRKGRQGNISFKSFYGKDVQEGITLTEQGQLSKNNIFGNGYRDGIRTSIGCSIKGKIWSYMRGNLLEFKKWSRMMGELVEDTSIDPNQTLQDTLKVRSIHELPNIQPIAIDWDSELYRDYQEHNIYLKLNKIDYQLWNVDLQLIQRDISEDIEFEIIINDSISRFCIKYGLNNSQPYYIISQLSGERIGIHYGHKYFDDICSYFNQNNSSPVIFFADGSQLFATNMVRVNETIIPFKREYLVGLDWGDVKLQKESQRVVPYETDSIQYFFSQKIKDEFDILYDDDGSGEIADLVGLKDDGNTIHIHLFHLKYAHGGVVNNQISNFYEVCGQALKCLKWNDKDKSRAIFTRLFARECKKYQGRECSRIIKGTTDDLERFSSQVNWKKDLRMHISIVQPSLSCSKPSDDILLLLGATSTYIKDFSNIDLKVYCSK